MIDRCLLPLAYLLRGYGLSLAALLFICLPAYSANPPSLTILMAERVAKTKESTAGNRRAVEIVNALAKETGLSLQIAYYPWRRAQKLAERGDALLWGVARTPEREQQFAFSPPLFSTQVWMVVPAGQTFPYRSVEDLRGKTIGIARGAQYGGDFTSQRGKLFNVEEEANTLPARLGMLTKGRIDLIFSPSVRPSPVAYAQLLNERWGDIGQWEVLPTPFSVDTIHIAAARNSPAHQHLPAISAAIQRLQRQGVIQRIVQAHLQAPARPGKAS